MFTGELFYFDLCQAVLLEAAFSSSSISTDTDPRVRSAWLEAMSIDGARVALEAKIRYLVAFGKAA